MEISGVNDTQAASAIAASGLSDNFDSFLQLLTTQLQNQDPLEPLDSNEFVAQLVQFTEVEQSIETNSLLEHLLAKQNTTQTTAALGYIGQTVEAKGDTGSLSDGGTIEYTYSLPDKAAATQIIIQNASGNAVAALPGQTAAGKHTLVWDGTDTSGNQLPPGKYTINVIAEDSDSNKIDATTSVVSQVTGVETDDHGVFLTIGDVKIPLEDIIAVTPAPQNPNS